MKKQLCWLPTLGSNGAKILHWRRYPSQRWEPYTTLPRHLQKPDINISTRYGNSSKGFATAQYLIKELSDEWEYVPSPVEDDANQQPQTYFPVGESTTTIAHD
jgi:hypothetical protein